MIFIDQYSYLHFATGIIMYFWGLSFWNSILVHSFYEIFENMEEIIYIINKYITIWPGGKSAPDPWLNRIGDVLFGTVGWITAYYLDKLGGKYGWYQPHLS